MQQQPIVGSKTPPLKSGQPERARRFAFAFAIAAALACGVNAQTLETAHGALQGTIHLYAGELQISAIDLDAGGVAGWNVLISRVYRSRNIGESPSLGQGWDASVFRRLRLLPIGDVEYRDETGEIWVFKPQPDAPRYQSEKGQSLQLARRDLGWVLVDTKFRMTEFDQYGRMTSERDEFGNVIRYQYGSNDRLARITDPLGRVTTLTWDEGASSGSPSEQTNLLKEITDWKVTYLYDSASRLIEVQLPTVPNSTSGAGRPTIRYGYYAGAASFSDKVELAANLVSITDPTEFAAGGPPRVTFPYGLTGPDRDRLKSETWATGETASFTYVSPTQVDVKDALGQVRSYTLYGPGRARIANLVERQVPTSTTPVGILPAAVTPTGSPTAPKDRTWAFQYNDDRLPTKGHLGGCSLYRLRV